MDRPPVVIDDHDLAAFEAMRPTLLGIAYRTIGSLTDAADVVQDTYLAWAVADRAAVVEPRAWLVTVCTRRAIDATRAAHRRRVDYVGPWLPDLVRTEPRDEPEARAELAATVTTAFLLVLERLAARDRAAFVLREVFGLPYEEVGDVIGTTPDTARQVVARARSRVVRAEGCARPAAPRTDRLLPAFLRALETGTPGELIALMAEDVTLTADSGGLVPAIGRVLRGAPAVAEAIVAVLAPVWRRCELRAVTLNDQAGFEVVESGVVVAAVTLGVDGDGALRRLDIMRHPGKLRALGAAVVR